jgi:hypothetical protein
MIGVVRVGERAIHQSHLHRDDAEPFGLEPVEDAPDDAAPDRVRFDQNERALGHGVSFAVLPTGVRGLVLAA